MATLQLRRSPAKRSAPSRPLGLNCYAQARLVLYTKPDCPLCLKLKSQVTSLLERAQFVTSSLTAVEFEEIDITSSEELLERYASRVPVLWAQSTTGRQAWLPPLSPRLTTERIGRKLETVFNELT